MFCDTQIKPTTLAEFQRYSETQEQTIRELRLYIAELEERIALLTAKRFGPSSEKQKKGEKDPAPLSQSSTTENEETLTVPAHQRRRAGRKPLPNHLPRVDIVYELDDENLYCPEDGHRLVVIGEETSEQLDFVPQQLQALRHIRLKYGCPCCQSGVKTAPLPPQPIPKSIASPGLLAYVATTKCQDGLPLYRQERLFKRLGVEITRATLASWLITLSYLFSPLIKLMREEMLAYDIIGMDETVIQVLKEPGRAPTSQSYLWVQRGGPPDRPMVLFDYDPSRSQSIPLRLLADFKGYLGVDGYDGYNAVGKLRNIFLKGCWAHYPERNIILSEFGYRQCACAVSEN
jgi:transposase